MHVLPRRCTLPVLLGWALFSLARFAGADEATPADQVTVPDGFHVDRIYSVPNAAQGSWVSLTCDPRGRLIASDQYGSLYRITAGANEAATRVEKLEIGIGDAQGLLYVANRLYVVVNGDAAEGSGLYRLTDTNGDDQFDAIKLLKRIDGKGEHGPHAVRLGPDGMLYVIAGNFTKLPKDYDRNSPHRNWAEDLLLPRNPDGRGFATGLMAPGGWVARTDLEGRTWEILCAGFRNPYDMDFNQDGELFTYDADMEWDTGTPWYRPTRICQIVSGGEFGWRYGTGKWPAYYPDSCGPVVDIGLGSPTGVAFGTGARFPARYQRALFANDWTYGKIYAVHMRPEGAGYAASFEIFAQAKPLPVTDVVINPHDGALYFTVGGRKTQSALYRVTYVGKEATERVGPIDDPDAVRARQLRRHLEAFHVRRSPQAIALAWPYLGSPDRVLRYAARVAVERQDPATWEEKAFSETRTDAVVQAMLALTRSSKGGAKLQARILKRLNELPLPQLSESQLLDALRVYQLALIRLGSQHDAATMQAVVARLDPLFPGPSPRVNRELCRLLVYLDAPGVIRRGMAQLRQARTQQDQLYYVFVLRSVTTGWTTQERRAYFSWLNLAEAKYRGGASFQNFIRQIRKDAVAKLPAAEKGALAEVIAGHQQADAVGLETTRQFVHNWQISDLLPRLGEVAHARSFQRGREAFAAAQCAKCHRFNGAGGATGPDITGVGNRFTPQYLLESLIEPSKAVSDQYRATTIVTNDGNIISGYVVDENKKRLRIRTNPFSETLSEIPTSRIEARKPSDVSVMPTGLINVLTSDEVLDLIAYLRSAGNRDDAAFRQAGPAASSQ